MAPKAKKAAAAPRSSKAPAGTKPGAGSKPAPKRKAEVEAAANAPGPSKRAAAPTKQPARRAPGSQPSAKRRRITKEFGLAQAGEVFTFGSNPFGALGLGEDVTEKPRPAAIELPAPAAQVACGGMHTVALTTDGQVYTWGVNDEGALGRCTSGSAWDDAKAAAKEDPAQPGRARLPDDVSVVMVAAGDGFTFALAEDGSLWGWGCFKDDNSGKSGFQPGNKLQRLPAKVYAPESVRDRVRKVVAGSRHVALLTRRGEVLTFGMGGQGQLGRVAAFDNESYPPLDLLLKPAPVEGLSGAGDVADVGCGVYSTFAVTARGGVWSWGLNNTGQLGLPLAPAESTSHFVWEPAEVEGLEGIASVAGGEGHTLALTKKGRLLSFGAPKYGALGRANAKGAGDRGSPEARPVDGSEGLGDETPASISAGTNVSATVTAEGNAYLFGSNVNLQMAKGDDDSDNLQPARMRRTKTFGNRRVLALCFGGQHGALLAGPDLQDGSLASPAQK